MHSGHSSNETLITHRGNMSKRVIFYLRRHHSPSQRNDSCFLQSAVTLASSERGLGTKSVRTDLNRL